MKKILLATTMVTLFITSVVQAADSGVAGGQVDFYGSVTDVSCTISVDGQGSDASIYVAPIVKSEITADTLLKAKSFTIDVSNCQPAAIEDEESETIKVMWVGGNLLENANNGYLANPDEIDGAKNIHFALSRAASSTLTNNIIIPGDASQPKVPSENLTTNGNIAASRFTYYVGYVTSTPDDVISGELQSYATYQISYD